MFKKIVILIKKSLKQIKFYKGTRRYDLLIYDDIFPNRLSGFRLQEFTAYLQNLNSKIIIDGRGYPILKQKKENFIRDIQTFGRQYPELKPKLGKKKLLNNVHTKLFYCVFLNNIFSCFPYLEKYKIPFAFTLYPGGGFKLDNYGSDSKLHTVLKSNNLRFVIVTQKISYDYLIAKKWCDENKIKFIWGSVIPVDNFNELLREKNHFTNKKQTLNIVFCAAKYMEDGKDKGYDLFIEVARLLAKKYSFIRFHVVGGFSQSDLPIRGLEHKIKFYGYVNNNDLKELFSDMDILISPNRPFLISDGAFDGFPLGASVEAALMGVVLIVTDELKQNLFFESGRDLFITRPNTTEIIIIVEQIIEGKINLRDIAESCKKILLQHFGYQSQIQARLQLIKENIL